MRALAPLQGMDAIRFADFQAVSTPEEAVPDVCLGLVSNTTTPDNALLVGKFKTPWTVPTTWLYLHRPNTSYHLERLIGLPSS